MITSTKLKLYATLLLACLLPAMGEEETLDLTLLEDALEKRDLHESVTAVVIQKKTLPSIAEPLVTKGNLWLLPRKAFRWEQGDPVSNIALYAKDEVYLINVQEKSVEMHDDDDKEVRPLMLLLGMGEDSTFKGLLKNFRATALEVQENSFTVTLLPDSGTMKRALTSLTLDIDLDTSFPSKIIWEQRDGSVIETTFQNLKINEPLEENKFSFSAENYVKKD